MEKVCFGLITGAVKPAANISPEKAGIEQNEKRKPKLTLSLLQKEKSHNIWPKYSFSFQYIVYFTSISCGNCESRGDGLDNLFNFMPLVHFTFREGGNPQWEFV